VLPNRTRVAWSTHVGYRASFALRFRNTWAAVTSQHEDKHGWRPTKWWALRLDLAEVNPPM
jgi:hypothetical protein